MAGTVCFAEIDQSIGDEGCMSQTIRWQGHQANGLDTLAFFQAAVLAKRSVHVNVKGCFSGTTDPYLTYFSLLDNT